MSLSSIAKLSVILTATTGPFSKGLKGAGSMLARFGDGVTDVGARLAKLGAVAGGAAAAGLAAMAVKGFAAVSAAGALSENLRITTDSLLGLQGVARLSGASADAMASALENLSVVTGKAEAGNAKAAKSLGMVGLAAQDLIGLSPDQQFAKIADGINRLGSASEQAAAAQMLFGSSGTELLQTLRLGSDGLAAATAEVNALQGAVSALDTAQVLNAGDSFENLKLLVEGLANQLAIQLAPFIAYIADLFVSMGNSGGGAAGLIDRGMEIVARGIATAANIVNKLKQVFFNLQLAATHVIEFLVRGFASIARAAKDVADFLGLDIEVLNNAVDFAEQYAENLKQARKEIGATIRELDKADAGADILAKFEQIRADARAKAQERLESTVVVPPGVKDLIDAQREQEARDKERIDAEKELARELRRASETVEANFGAGRIAVTIGNLTRTLEVIGAQRRLVGA